MAKARWVGVEAWIRGHGTMIIDTSQEFCPEGAAVNPGYIRNWQLVKLPSECLLNVGTAPMSKLKYLFVSSVIGWCHISVFFLLSIYFKEYSLFNTFKKWDTAVCGLVLGR